MICTTFIPAYLNNNSSSLPPLHPRLLDQLPLHLFSADPGIMNPVPGPTVNVGTITAVKSVKESILVSTAPFGPQRRLLSAHGPLALHGANARGVETVTGLSTSPSNNVNSVQFCRSVLVSHGFFPFLLLLLCLLHLFRHQAASPRDSLLKPPFPVRAWLPIPFKIWSLRLGLPPLMLTNCGVNFVFTLTKSKWIM